MECNKDEAVRAKEIAEKKMHENDFDGARRVALKAQQLYPEIENISQLLTVCNVHCSAEKKILGSEKDWYGVLQIERLADEATIKKQYRKLALVLHPDKNKFPGAEAAFKLIGEAHVVLSDPQKRTVYDSKFRVLEATTTYKANTNPPARKQSAAHNSAANGFSSQFGGWNQYPATQYNSTPVDESFWTCCPFCKIKYMFYRNLQNKMLRCQKCLKAYIAYEIAAHGVLGSDQSQATAQRVPGSNQSQATAQRVPGSNQSQAAAQGVPPTFNRSQPGVSRQKDDPVQGIYGASGLKAGGPMAPGFCSQGNASGGGGPVGSVSGTGMRSNAKVGQDNKTKDGQKEGAAMPKADKLQNEAECRVKNRKRGRKPEQESSASCESSDSSIMDDIDMKETSSGHAGGASFGVNASDFVRRSHRQKHQVSYNENETDDDDFESPPKRSRKEESSNGEGEPEAVVNDVPSFAKPAEQKRRVESPGVSGEANSQTAGQTATVQNGVARECELVDVSDSDDDGSDGKSFLVPDAEFNNFDKLREEEGFAVDQFWACYDDADGMPRFYAQIRKVNSSPFRLRITWLEFSPNDQGERDWETEGLPIGCGKFKRGDSQDETNIGVFSHKMVCQKGAQRGSWLVYPQKGEIWALFKDWDIKWSTDSDNHKHWKYEIVEVISDFMEGAGVKVAYLERMRGFVSLFQQRSQNRIDSVLVPAAEMLRFSHCIPFFKMSGTEKEGVPKGSYELDPACLPANPEDVFCPSYYSDAADGESGRAEAKCSKPAKMNRPKSVSTPKKPTEHLRKNDVGGETDKIRRSPRGQKNAVPR